MSELWKSVHPSGACPAAPETPEPRRGRRGFTLIEVIVVLVVILVLASVGLYAVQQLIPRIQLDSSAQAVDVLLKRMRLLAVKRSIEISMQVEDSGETPRNVAYVNGNPDQAYFLVARNAADNSFLASTPIPSQREGRKIELLDITFPAETIRFTRIGDVPATGALRYGIQRTPTLRMVRAISIPNLTGRSLVEAYDETTP